MAKKINAFEMWLYRRMLRIPWTAHKTNEEVLTMMNTKLTLLTTIKQRKTAYFGHIMRRNGLQRLLADGKLDGKRGRARPRTLCMDSIKERTKLWYAECVRKADNNRQEWWSAMINLLREDNTT